MSKVLVTGATGFVGSELCKVLHSRGMPYVAAVRRTTNPDQVNVGSFSATTDWSPALHRCDVVMHLAARVHVMGDTTIDPLSEYRLVNVDATLNLANQAIKHGVKRFVFVSSIKVNGEETAGRPFQSSDSPAPVDPYGQSKLEAERALLELSRSSGLEVVIVRPPLVYGPGVRANFLSLMRLVKLGLPLPLGRIDNRRSMVALDNLVDLLVLCSGHPGAAGQTYLVSDGDDLSTSGLITLIARSMNKSPLLLPAPVKMVESVARMLGKTAIANRLFGSLQVDITHTKDSLGWLPIMSTEEAMKKTVSHFLTHG